MNTYVKDAYLNIDNKWERHAFKNALLEVNSDLINLAEKEAGNVNYYGIMKAIGHIRNQYDELEAIDESEVK